MEDVQRIDNLYGFEFREPDKRRVPTEERKTYDIQSLWQRNHEIINLAARGFNNVTIAEILNINPQTVSNTLNSELGKRKLSEWHGRIMKLVSGIMLTSFGLIFLVNYQLLEKPITPILLLSFSLISTLLISFFYKRYKGIDVEKSDSDN